MVGNARFVSVSLLVRKPGEIETSIVPNISAGFVFPKYGSNTHAAVTRQEPKAGKKGLRILVCLFREVLSYQLGTSLEASTYVSRSVDSCCGRMSSAHPPYIFAKWLCHVPA